MDVIICDNCKENVALKGNSYYIFKSSKTIVCAECNDLLNKFYERVVTICDNSHRRNMAPLN